MTKGKRMILEQGEERRPTESAWKLPLGPETVPNGKGSFDRVAASLSRSYYSAQDDRTNRMP